MTAAVHSGQQPGGPHIDLGDFTLDGIPDLAVKNGGRVSILAGLGDGTFYLVGHSLMSGDEIAVAHLNSDPWPDLVIGGESTKYMVAFGRGGASFSDPVRLGIGYGEAFAVDDLDGDGIQDLLPGIGDSIRFLAGQGDGSFDLPPTHPAGDGPVAIAVADFDADGWPDLAVANELSGDISILVGGGNGSFAAPSRLEVGGRPADLAVADLDGDGWKDLVVINDGPSESLILRGVGAATFVEHARYPEIANAQVVLGDFDADGFHDLAVASGATYQVFVRLGNGDATFGEASYYNWNNWLWSLPYYSLVTGDFNGDGAEDLAEVTHEHRTMFVLAGNGDGSFAPALRSHPISHPRGLAAGDFDRDGHTDLVVGSYDRGGVAFARGNGDGTFGTMGFFDAGSRPGPIVLGDFDRDGLQDLAVANHQSQDVSVLRGHGDGTFAEQTRFAAGETPIALAAEDLNGDGQPDLVVANYDTDDFQVLLNRGNRAPVAVAGGDAAAECTSPAGAVMTLDGSGSSDLDSAPGTNDDIVLFEWFEDFGTPSETLLGVGEVLEATLPLGVHLFALRVTDRAGATDMDELMLSVQDTTPPVLTVEVHPETLWPPNHRMRKISAIVVASDVCSAELQWVLTSIASSQPDDVSGGDDGHTVNDIQGADLGTSDREFLLRAERSTKEDTGRLYTVTYRATDSSGNTAIAEAVVAVPRHRQKPLPASILVRVPYQLR